MANKKIIELDAASQINSDALFVTSQLVSGNQKTLKATVAQMQAAMLAPVSGLVTLGESLGSIASFSTDISDKLFSCYVNVVASQAGSGTPAPDNVRTISGWSACNLSAIGVNLAKLTPRAQESSNGIISTIYDDNRIVANGTSSGNGDIGIDFANELKLDSNKSYTISLTGTDTRSASLNIFFHYKNGAYTSPFAISNSAHKATFNNIGGIFDRILLRTSNTFTISLDAKLQIEVGTSQSTYTSYNGTTHNIPFNTTVYGGVLDVLSGVLTVTHGMVDLGDLNWAYVSSGDRFTSNGAENTIKRPSSDSIAVDMICEKLNVMSLTELKSSSSDNLIACGDTGILSARYTTSGTDANAFKTAINGTKLVYPLATPTTIQLTPTEVKTILGQNNIFADCGDIDLKYLETIGNRLS